MTGCFRFLLALLIAAPWLAAQRPVRIQVDLSQRQGAVQPAWACVGYDEPNYTTSAGGRLLLAQLAALSSTPVCARTHNLLTTGDGKPALKWGSTNAYTETAAGAPDYDWTILDEIFDAYQQAGIKPLVEIGFMPEALSTHPRPYRHQWPQGPLFTGWSYPPRDYDKWAALVRHWVEHCVARYGPTEVAGWEWEVWNEPNIGYWHGTVQEYEKLYDYTSQAVKTALPAAHVGGPATTGPASPRAAAFLRHFLAHCVSGPNAATGKTGAPLDFISFHAKGVTDMADGHVRMNIGHQLQDIAQGFQIVASFPSLHALPVILTESDPEGCAACVATTHPQNAYRNEPLYASYTADVLVRTQELARQYRVDFSRAVTWAFEYDGQPWFAGYRTLSTHGVAKPILNLFRMLGMMQGQTVAASSSGALSTEELMEGQARLRPDINAIAASGARRAQVLLWNYFDADVPAPAASISLAVRGLPQYASRVLVRHYRIGAHTSNAYAAWLALQSPQQPSSQQYDQLQRAGQLQLLSSPEWLRAQDGSLRIDFKLPRQAVSLLELDW